ncbi:MAG: hypothetical protein PVF54_10845, partial [Anaerolineae bacterium]
MSQSRSVSCSRARRRPLILLAVTLGLAAAFGTLSLLDRPSLAAPLAERTGDRPPVAATLLAASWGVETLEASEPDPTVTTDKADYAPGETVIITGTGFSANTDYVLIVIRPDDEVDSVTVTSDGGGTFTYAYQLNGILGTYEVRVYPSGWQGDLSVEPLASTTFTDKPSANIDQCASGAVKDLPDSTQCITDSWQNGNLNANQAHYFEGDSVPYRTIMDGELSIGETYTVTLNWDVSKVSGGEHQHTIDYLTSFDRTETDAEPCDLGPGTVCDGGTEDTLDIPTDPTLGPAFPDGDTFGGTQEGGVFTLFGGEWITHTGYISDLADGTNSIGVSFQAVSQTAVLAWGGHIASRADWGPDQSAGAVSGSPYHMRLIGFECSDDPTCSVGNQDRSLTASAVILPGTITVIKDAVPDDPTDFNFTTNFTTTAFSGTFKLDDAVPDDGDDFTSTEVITKLVPSLALEPNLIYGITETVPPGWDLTGIACQSDDGTSGAFYDLPSVDITLAEADDVTCVFANTQRGSITVEKQTLPDGASQLFDFSGDIVASLGDEDAESKPVEPGQYSVTETVPTGWNLTSIACDDENSLGSANTATFNV